MIKKLLVDLAKSIDNSYFINFEPFVCKYDNAYYLIDSNVYDLHKDRFRNVENFYIFKSSEENKIFDSVIDILKWLRDKGCKRDSTLVVVGGGVVGDVGGFVSAIYMRGINFIQVPTSLLAMVDSSIGGKTGINFSDTKNLVGAFKQPVEVIIDVTFLDTLPFDEYKNGLAEVVKYGLMFDKEFCEFLIKNKDCILNKASNYKLVEMIYRCCELKAYVVKEDEFEHGIRKFLNFGHTIGHAIEIDSNHTIKHGFAVAIGMFIESLIGMELGVVDKDTVDYTKNLLECYDFNTFYKAANDSRFLEALKGDKKIEKDGLVLSLTNPIGTGKIVKGVDFEKLQKILLKYGVLNG
ncbi:3-dehydroquinate synthase [Deferribacter thermophilus]|uniref:3-dehydroquinate synthase n=1 Tax=Deferribacter thermophilus TaxID=53573 RepID=UPI003C1448FF